MFDNASNITISEPEGVSAPNISTVGHHDLDEFPPVNTAGKRQVYVTFDDIRVLKWWSDENQSFLEQAKIFNPNLNDDVPQTLRRVDWFRFHLGKFWDICAGTGGLCFINPGFSIVNYEWPALGSANDVPLKWMADLNTTGTPSDAFAYPSARNFNLQFSNASFLTPSTTREILYVASWPKYPASGNPQNQEMAWHSIFKGVGQWPHLYQANQQSFNFEFLDTDPQGSRVYFYDMVFECMKPYTKKELEILDINQPSSYYNIRPEYNYFLKQYEEATSEAKTVGFKPADYSQAALDAHGTSAGSVMEQERETAEDLFPNLYILLSEGKNQELDSELGLSISEYSNPDYFKLATLNGRIPHNMVRPEMILSENDNLDSNHSAPETGNEFVGKSFSGGQYFVKWSENITEALSSTGLAASRIKLKNIIVPEELLVNNMEVEQKKRIFPMYNEIEFSTDARTNFANFLKEANLTNTLLKCAIAKANDISTPGIPRLTTNLQAIDHEGNVDIFSSGMTDDFGNLKLNAFNLKDFIEAMEEGMDVDVSKLTTSLGKQDLNNSIDTDGFSNFIKKISLLAFKGKSANFANNYFRTYKNILEGKLSYSETLFYRIDKKIGNSNRSYQNIWMVNSSETNIAKYIDTQVKYDQNYTYEIKEWKIVVGTKYSYSQPHILSKAIATPADGVSVEANRGHVDVICEPYVFLIEVPYASGTSKILDDPPLAPDVNFIPFRNINNKILLTMDANYGSLRLDPVMLNSTDQEKINIFRQAKGYEADVPILYEGDDTIKSYEVYRTTVKPTSYADFNDKKYLILDSIERTTYIDKILPNKKYYYTARAIDSHDHFSNPTAIYEVELLQQSNTNNVFPSITVYDIEKEQQKAFLSSKSTSKSMRKFLCIKPSITQNILNTDKTLETKTGEGPATVWNTTPVMGVEDETTFGKTFKIRITSKKTGRKIDINTTFTTKMKNVTVPSQGD